MTYYLKKLKHQELGSVGENGKPNRGRYLLTSSNESVLSFFPHLSQTQLNDSALLAIIPMYLKDNKKVYCNYVWHNDKYHGSTVKNPRDEYRIYSNKKLENKEYLFKENDIVVFKKGKLSTNGPPDEDYDETVYFMDLINGSQRGQTYTFDIIPCFQKKLSLFIVWKNCGPIQKANVGLV